MIPADRAALSDFSLRAAMREASIDAISTLVILGSGLAGLYADDELSMLGDETTVLTEGHPGRLGLLKSRPEGVLVAIGRRHLYEGASYEMITAIVRMAAAAGATRLVVTNAAGGLDPRFRRGDIMLIDGVIGSLLGRHLGAGCAARPAGGGGLDRDEADRLAGSALSRGVALRRGVYAGVTGPSYETRAEIRMLRRMGASAVGMSTVPEIIAARTLGMSVVGLSLITNVASDTVRAVVDHGEVLESGREAVGRMRRVLDMVL
jgi:purine-nucleoside phosphorylase